MTDTYVYPPHPQQITRLAESTATTKLLCCNSSPHGRKAIHEEDPSAKPHQPRFTLPIAKADYA